jgi:hypothetical protein
MSLQQTIKTGKSRDLYRRIYDFKRGYQLRHNLVKDENCDRLTDSHKILHGQKNCFSQLLNLYNISDIKQIEIDTAEPLVTVPAVLMLKLLLDSKGSINCHIVFKFCHK